MENQNKQEKELQLVIVRKANKQPDPVADTRRREQRRRRRRINRFVRKLTRVVCRLTLTLTIILGLWLIASFVEVVAHNIKFDGYEYSKYNFFVVITKDYAETLELEETEVMIDNIVPVTDVEEETVPELPVLKETPKYTDDEVEMLARVIYGEAGADWCSDEMQLYVGSVVLNRIKSPYFPDTMEEVIFQTHPLQYACTLESGNYWDTPTERCYLNAEKLLTEGSVLPENVIFQAEFTQGDGVYCKEQNMYFCYIDVEEE